MVLTDGRSIRKQRMILLSMIQDICSMSAAVLNLEIISKCYLKRNLKELNEVPLWETVKGFECKNKQCVFNVVKKGEHVEGLS